MKKNKAMRAAGGLFIATMLSTSIISGTYAKYVYSGSSSQTARVAAFGATLSTSGQLFDTTYLNTANSNKPANGAATGITVRSLAKYGTSATGTDNIVAPGTKNDDGLVISFSGTPEVSCKVSFNVTSNSVKDIFLGAGTWTDMTKDVPATPGNDYTGVTLDTPGYYPVKFTLSQKKGTGDYTAVNGCTDVTLATIAAYLDGVSSDFTYDVSNAAHSGNDLGEVLGSYKLTWEWAFETETDAKGTTFTDPDKLDTILGDLVTTTATKAKVKVKNGNAWEIPAAGSYSTDVAIEFTATIEQID